MTAASTNAQAALPRPWWCRRVLWLPLLAIVLVVAGGIGGWLWYRNAIPIPPPPAPDLDGVDPAVAAAIDKERQHVLRSPRDASAWGRLGEVLTAFNYRTEAVFCFAQAERLDPREPRWPYHQGILLLIDDPEAAIPRFRRAVELCGDDADLPRLRLSEALLAQGHLDEAEKGFRDLLARDRLNPRVQLGLGRLELQRQHWRQAVDHLRLAAADRRTAKAASIALAEGYRSLDEEQLAAQSRRRVEQLPPDPPWPDKFLTEIQRFNTGKRARIMRADQLFKEGRHDEAIAEYTRVTKDYPDSREAWFSLGQALYRVWDYASAERALQKAVELAPGFAEAHNYLGLAQLKQGRLEAAAASFRKATELKPDFAPAYSNLGLCLIQQKDQAGAIAAFRAAVRYKPDYAAAYTELAELLHQAHQDAEALEQARRALQLNPAEPVRARAKQLVEKLQRTRPSDLPR